MAESISPKALAAQIGCNPKALRRFMRALADKQTQAGIEPGVARVGQGNRYDLSAAQARTIKAAWAKAHSGPRKTEAEIEAVAHDAIVAP